MPRQPDPNRQLLSLTEAAIRYGVSERWIRTKIAEGVIRGYKLGGGNLIRIDQAEADAKLLDPIATGWPGNVRNQNR